MAKRYFSSEKKKDPNLFRIIAVLTLLVAGLYWGLPAAKAFWEGHSAAKTEAAASGVLKVAEALLQDGKAAEAAAVLEPIAHALQDAELSPRSLLLLARAKEEQGEVGSAVELLKGAYESLVGNPEHPRIATRYAELAEKQGDGQSALKVYEDICANAAPGMRVSALMGLGRLSEKGNSMVEARDFYRQALADAMATQDDTRKAVWDVAAHALGRLNVALFFSPMETPESKYYAVEPGDTLTSIGMKLNTTQGSLIRANAIDDPGRLRLNQRLKHTPKDFRIVVERSACRIFLLDKQGLFKSYRTGLGMPGYETVLGRYTIGNKQKDPTWFRPGGSPVPPGDPENELGTRWMPLVPIEEGLPSDLGIHGTIVPETIGQYKSHGCPRMYKEDVEELYDLVVRSTPVEVVEEYELPVAG